MNIKVMFSWYSCPSGNPEITQAYASSPQEKLGDCQKDFLLVILDFIGANAVD